MKLASDSEVGASHIDVDVKNGVVTLKGRVENEKKRQKAGKVAKKVKGVTSVQNEITVGPPK